MPFVAAQTAAALLRADSRGDGIVIDLRAPVEFADDAIEGAINVPLFEDTTRAFVGLLYKQQSPEAAFQEGRAAVAKSIDALVANIAKEAEWEIPAADLAQRVMDMTSGGLARMEQELVPRPVEDLGARPVLLHCARGGMRSRSVVALLRALGLDRAVGLEGGYRAYRRHAMAAIEEWVPPGRVVSLRGLTGVGKTLVLREIERMRPGWTLDLEGCAGHRSSLLGMVGLRPVTQKRFESRLFQCVRGGFKDGVMIMEGESRKVGDAIIPRMIWDALQAATNVEVTASIPRRVDVLSEDYLRDPSALPLLREQLVAVADRMDGRPDLAGMLDRGEISPLVESLLANYYDPLYRRSESGKVYALRVEAECATQAAEAVVSWSEAS